MYVKALLEPYGAGDPSNAPHNRHIAAMNAAARRHLAAHAAAARAEAEAAGGAGGPAGVAVAALDAWALAGARAGDCAGDGVHYGGGPVRLKAEALLAAWVYAHRAAAGLC